MKAFQREGSMVAKDLVWHHSGPNSWNKKNLPVSLCGWFLVVVHCGCESNEYD